MLIRPPLACALLAAALSTAGCGTIGFPERLGMPHSSRLDPNVVLLDAAGLLLFLVPGIVAFAVDHHTGALYLPHGVERGEGPFFRDE